MHWENITEYYYAWGAYLVGAAGCSLATWWLFKGMPRAFVHFLVITVMALLVTPYAMDPDTMVMAPALVALGYGSITEGFTAVKPVLKPVIGVWAVLMVLSLVYQWVTRDSYLAKRQRRQDENDQIDADDELLLPPISHSHQDRLPNEVPLRAER